MNPKVRLWKRDYEIIEAVGHGLHTTSQIAALYFPSTKKASERMKLLFKAGYVGRFAKPVLGVRGKPEFVYCAKGRSMKRNYATVFHALAVSEFKIRFLSWLKASGFSGVFLYPAQLQNKLREGELIPDGIFTVEKDKKLLFFLEVDFGTESLSADKGYAFASKLDDYSDYFDDAGYKKDFEWLGSFKGFRVLVVFDSEKRLGNFQSIAMDKRADFALMTTWERLKSGFADCWISFDGNAASLLGKQGI
jgi:hypothetical protein